MWLDIALDADTLDAIALREAIAGELGCSVVANRELSHSGEIVVKPNGPGRVSVDFFPPGRLPPLRRSVILPKKPENRVQLLAWLVGNMARDEAAEWLAEHQREKDAAANADTNAPQLSAETKTEEPQALATGEPEGNLFAGNAANKNTIVNASKPVAGKAAPATTNGAVSGQAIVDAPSLRAHSVNFVVWHGLLELHPDAEQSRFAFQVGIGYGRVGAIRGFAFDLLHHREDVELQGLAASLGWTRVNRTQGLALSAGVVTAKGDLHGVDYAGLVSYRDGALSGAQLAGFASYATGDVVGGQAAGLFTASGSLHGLQLAWFANVASGHVTGAQASFVNVAENVDGLQLGLVNVAKRVDGVQVGLLNFAENVRTQAQLWSERTYLQNAGVRYVYAPMLMGVSTGYDSANDRLRVLFGLGARFAYSRFAWAPSVDLGGVIDQVSTAAVGRGHENDVRLSFEFEVVPRIVSVVAGPTLALRSDSNTKLRAVPRWFAGLTLL